ncbi:hypothetical protein TSAR_006643 [Trichomalopsis sarcophagae]|uniref:Uncharacterized protein n=1 Tax=Trichomalopsis sarcophagae TaxID=543379 RepID=A0A232EXW5_9HYME|nr:hypothetical protein TSAR_006643 [Trichomalopsis sarcophagae]
MVIFSRKYKLDAYRAPKLSGVALQVKDSAKYLGIVLDKKLTWEKHLTVQHVAGHLAVQGTRRGSHIDLLEKSRLTCVGDATTKGGTMVYSLGTRDLGGSPFITRSYRRPIGLSRSAARPRLIRPQTCLALATAWWSARWRVGSLVVLGGDPHSYSPTRDKGGLPEERCDEEAGRGACAADDATRSYRRPIGLSRSAARPRLIRPQTCLALATAWWSARWRVGSLVVLGGDPHSYSPTRDKGGLPEERCDEEAGRGACAADDARPGVSVLQVVTGVAGNPERRVNGVEKRPC